MIKGSQGLSKFIMSKQVFHLNITLQYFSGKGRIVRRIVESTKVTESNFVGNTLDR